LIIWIILLYVASKSLCTRLTVLKTKDLYLAMKIFALPIPEQLEVLLWNKCSCILDGLYKSGMQEDLEDAREFTGLNALVFA
jgi:hypothetical protein